MHVDTALTIINESLVYPPGYTVTATDHTSRFEDTVCVHVSIDAKRSERELAPEGYPEDVPGGARSSFPIAVGDIEDGDGALAALTYRVITALVTATTHEIREFVRVKPTYWAPFHPHRLDGIKRWSKAQHTDPSADFLFGLS